MLTRLLDGAEAELSIPTQVLEHSIDGWVLAVRPSEATAVSEVIRMVDTVVRNSSLRDVQTRWIRIKAKLTDVGDDDAHG